MGQRTVSQRGLDLVKEFEGIPDGNAATVNIDPYLDPVEIWTIGWGHAIRHQGRFLRGMAQRATAVALYPSGLTEPQCELLLMADLLDTCRDVEASAAVELNDNEFAALVSFTFNLGAGNLRASTLLRELNQDNRIGAANQFGRWVLADGKPLPGLVRRRGAERELFLTPP